MIFTWPVVVKLLVIFKAVTLLGPHEVLCDFHTAAIRRLCLEIKNRE